MNYKNNPMVDFLMLMIALFSIWTAVFVKESAQEKVKQINSDSNVIVRRNTNS